MLIVDALEGGRRAQLILQLSEAWRRVSRGGTASIQTLVVAESGFEPTGGWSGDERARIRSLTRHLDDTLLARVRHVIAGDERLSAADEAALLSRCYGLAIPALAAVETASVSTSVSIWTTSDERARTLRELFRRLNVSARITGIPGGSAHSSEVRAAMPSTLTYAEKDVLICLDSPAIAGTLRPIGERMVAEYGVSVSWCQSASLVPASPSMPNRVSDRSQDTQRRGSSNDALTVLGELCAAQLIAAGQATGARVSLLAETFRVRKPSLIVLGNDRLGPGAVVAVAAGLARVPVLSVQDGVAADSHPIWRIRHATLTASSGAQLQEIVRRESRYATVRITGQPRYDSWVGQASLASRDRGVPPGAPRILVALQDKHDAAYVRQLLAALAVVAESHTLDVVIRPHPSNALAKILRLASPPLRSQLTLDPGLPARDAIARSDLVIGQYSTLLVEAAAIGVPVISFSPSPTAPPLDLGNAGIAQVVSTRAALATAVLRALAEPPPAVPTEHIARLIGSLDGKAAERIAEWAATVAQASNP